MKLYFIIFLLNNIFVNSIYTKIVNTPIFENNQLLKLHHVVILKKTEFEFNKKNYNDIFIVEFGPEKSNINYKNIIMGNNVKGELLVYYFNNINLKDIENGLYTKSSGYYHNKLKKKYKNIYLHVNKWTTQFNIYNHNCRHFSKYLTKSI
jgi:hypothetical protein